MSATRHPTSVGKENANVNVSVRYPKRKPSQVDKQAKKQKTSKHATVIESVAGVGLSTFTQGFLEFIVSVPEFSEDKDLHEWIITADESIREFNHLNVVVDGTKFYEPPSELASQLCARIFKPDEQLLRLDEMTRYRFITTKVKNEMVRLLRGEELGPYCQLEKERVQIDLLFYSEKIDEQTMHRLLFDVHAREAVLMKQHGWIPNIGAMPSSSNKSVLFGHFSTPADLALCTEEDMAGGNTTKSKSPCWATYLVGASGSMARKLERPKPAEMRVHLIDVKPFAHPSICKATGHERAKVYDAYDAYFAHVFQCKKETMFIKAGTEYGISCSLHVQSFGMPMPTFSMTKHDVQVLDVPGKGEYVYNKKSDVSDIVAFIPHGEQVLRNRLAPYLECYTDLDRTLGRFLITSAVNSDGDACFEEGDECHFIETILSKTISLDPETVAQYNEFLRESRSRGGKAGVDNELWMKRYSELEVYKEEHGDCDVSQRYKINQQLAKWVMNQRTFYKNKKLSKERIDLLNGLGFTWAIDVEQKWMMRFNELEVYKEEHGDCDVPQRYEINQQLASWVNNQRKSYRNRKLSKDRINLLEKLEFKWEILSRKKKRDEVCEPPLVEPFVQELSLAEVFVQEPLLVKPSAQEPPLVEEFVQEDYDATALPPLPSLPHPIPSPPATTNRPFGSIFDLDDNTFEEMIRNPDIDLCFNIAAV